MLSSQACRFCDSDVDQTFVDLGISPLSNAYLTQQDLQKREIFYPLHAKICEQCFLVQLPQFETPEAIFSDYAYFSSYSDSWLQHSKNYANKMIKRFCINADWTVIEIASNDGYLLQYFKEHTIPVLGIEPAKNVAKVAEEKGIPTVSLFFGVETAKKLVAEGYHANLLIGNNVLAHVPDLNDFVAGLKLILAPHGVLTMEFPHLLKLMEENQFDTIYHEHFSYFSLLTVKQVFAKHGLTIFDVESIPVHGGSLRIYACHAEDKTKMIEASILAMLQNEKEYGLDQIKTYHDFTKQVEKIKQDLLAFLIKAKMEGKSVVGYGAPAKGNTMLNYCGINSFLLPYTVDRSPHKQNHFLPGTRIPVYSPDKINETKPDYVLLLPWNLKTEIMSQMQYIKEWGGRFVVPIPKVQVL